MEKHSSMLNVHLQPDMVHSTETALPLSKNYASVSWHGGKRNRLAIVPKLEGCVVSKSISSDSAFSF